MQNLYTYLPGNVISNVTNIAGDYRGGSTYIYEYDNSGNITSVKKYALTASGVTPSGSYTEEIYSYSDAEWGDLLVGYNGRTITYDEIGNPTSYYNGGANTTIQIWN